MNEEQNSAANEHRPIDPDVRIGHTHLKVANLNRTIAFYHGVLGLK